MSAASVCEVSMPLAPAGEEDLPTVPNGEAKLDSVPGSNAAPSAACDAGVIDDAMINNDPVSTDSFDGLGVQLGAAGSSQLFDTSSLAGLEAGYQEEVRTYCGDASPTSANNVSAPHISSNQSSSSPLSTTPIIPEDAVCRVCHCEGEPEAARPLFHPCRCSGSIKYVHEDCLKSWIQISKKPQCELCGEAFTFRKVYKEDMPPELSLVDVLVALGPKIIAAVAESLEIAFPWILYALIVPLLTYVEIEVAVRIALRAPLRGMLHASFSQVTLMQFSICWFLGASANVVLLQVIYLVSWLKSFLAVRQDAPHVPVPDAARVPVEPRNTEREPHSGDNNDATGTNIYGVADEGLEEIAVPYISTEAVTAGFGTAAHVNSEPVSLRQSEGQEEDVDEGVVSALDETVAVDASDRMDETEGADDPAGLSIAFEEEDDDDVGAAVQYNPAAGKSGVEAQNMIGTDSDSSHLLDYEAVSNSEAMPILTPTNPLLDPVSAPRDTGPVPPLTPSSAAPEPASQHHQPQNMVPEEEEVQRVAHRPPPLAEEVGEQHRHRDEGNRNNAANDEFGIFHEANTVTDHISVALGILALNAAIFACTIVLPVFLGKFITTHYLHWDLDAQRAGLRFLVEEATQEVRAELRTKRALDEATVTQIHAYLSDRRFIDFMMKAIETLRFWIFGSSLAMGASVVGAIIAYCGCWALGYNVPRFSNPFNANLYRNFVQSLSNTVYIIKLVGLIISEVVILPICVGLLIDVIVLKNLGVTIHERMSYLRANPFSYFALRGTIGGMFIAHLSAILSAVRDCLILSASQALLIDPEILSIVQRPDQRPYVNEATRSPLSLIMRVIVNLIVIVPAVLFMIMIPARFGHHLLLEPSPIALLNELPDFRTGIPIDMALLHIFTAVLNPKYFAFLERLVRRMLMVLCELAGVAEYVLQDYALRRHQEHQERQLREIEEIERLINVFAATAGREEQSPEAEDRSVGDFVVDSAQSELLSAHDRSDAMGGEPTSGHPEPDTGAVNASNFSLEGEGSTSARSNIMLQEPALVTDRVLDAAGTLADRDAPHDPGAGADASIDADESNMNRLFQSVATEVSELTDFEEDEVLGEPDVPRSLAARLVVTAILFLSSISIVSAASLVYPMALGRYLIAAAGFSFRNDLYSTALGYIVLVPAGMAINVVVSRLSERADVLHFVAVVRDFVDLLVKAGIILIVWGFIIPCCFGALWNCVLVSAFAPVHVTTLISMREVYGIGFLCVLLSIKGSVVGIDLFQPLKQRIDRVRAAGLRNLSYSYILDDLGWTFVVPLVDALVIPYALGAAIQRAMIAVGVLHYEAVSLVGRYAHMLVIAVYLLNKLRLAATAAARDLYEQARDSRYLVGVQLTNR